MMRRRMTGRRSMVAALVASATISLVWLEPGPAIATHVNEVTAVNGVAYNYFTNVSLFGGPFNRRGYGQDASAPATAASPSVSCPAGGGNPTATDPDGAKAQYGPAVIFGGKWPADQSAAPPSGPLTSSLDCRLGEAGYVTASTSATLMPAGSGYPGGVGPGPFIADEVHSTCTVRADGTRSASTTIVNGILETSYDPNTQEPATTEAVPTNPDPNYTRTGTIDHVGDSYRIVFNEQTLNADGSITVAAAHMYLLGPTAVGDMVIGSATCGPLATTPISHSGGATTTTVPATTTTTTATTTTTTTTTSTTAPTTTITTTAPAPAGSVIGRAFGYFTNVGLFGGSPSAKGPTPTVTLPSAGSASPVTASAPSGIAQYGPAVLFQSGPISLSTQGTPGPTGSVTTSARIMGSPDGPGPFLYKEVSSTCTANPTGATGATSIVGGVLETKYDVNTQEPIASVPLAASPAPNTELTGTIDHVGDRFRIVFNEQARSSDGTLTVNAAHMYLLGPIAVGEMIIGQTVCGMSAASPTAATPVPAGGASGSTDPVTAATAGPRSPTVRSSSALPSAGETSRRRPSVLARTGASVQPLVLVSLLSLLMGSCLVVWGRRRPALAGAGLGTGRSAANRAAAGPRATPRAPAVPSTATGVSSALSRFEPLRQPRSVISLVWLLLGVVLLVWTGRRPRRR